MSLACDTARRADTVENEIEHDATVGTAGAASGDRNFVAESLRSGMAEIELAKLAQQRAVNPDVKGFAEMMIRDHSKAGETLRQVARQHAIDPNAELGDEHRDLVQELTALRGAEFDREYMDAMVDSHQNVVDHLQSRASEDRFGDDKGTVRPEASDNPVERDLNQWAASTLPTARHHLDEARRINDGLDNQVTRARPRTDDRREPAARPAPRTQPEGDRR